MMGTTNKRPSSRLIRALGAAFLGAAAMIGVEAVTAADALAQSSRNPVFQRVGSWSVLVAGNRGNGCYIHRTYPNGQSARLGIDARKQTFYLSFYDRGWRSIRSGRSYPITATFNFDRNTLAKGTGTGSRLGSIPGLRLEGLKIQYVRRFAERRSMQIFYQNRRIGSFDLTGSRRALSVMVRCQRQYGSGRDPFGGGSNDPFSGGGSSSSTDPFGQRNVGNGGNRSNDPFY